MPFFRSRSYCAGVLSGFLLIALALVLASALWARAAPRFADPAIVPAGISFRCTPVKVWDGDGPVWCAEGPRLRIAGVAARESDGSCRSNQPCPAASAEAARDALVRLVEGGRAELPHRFDATGHVIVRGPILSCLSDGSGGGKRTAAWCVSPAVGDLSCALLRTGTVLRWQRYWRRHRC